MSRVLRTLIIAALAFLFPVIGYAQYNVISEDYESDHESLFLSEASRVVDGDGINNTKFIEPLGDLYRLGFAYAESEFGGTVTVDFRAKAVEGAAYFSFDTRQNSDYKKTFTLQFKNNSIIQNWRYYRIVIDFDKQITCVYSSESGFEAIGKVESKIYSAAFSDATGFNMFRFINCKLDDISIYSDGSAPYVKSASVKKYGARLAAEYVFADNENNNEGRTEIFWERSADGKSFSEVYGENDKSYALTRFDTGKYFRAKIVPYSTTYPEMGEEYYTDSIFVDDANDYTLTDRAGNEVFALSDGVYSFKAKLKSGKCFTAALAVYNADGSLHSVYYRDGTNIEIDNIVISGLGQGGHHKVFFWDSIENMKPVYDSDEQKETLYREALGDLPLTVSEQALYNASDYSAALCEHRKIFFENIQNISAKSELPDNNILCQANELYENNTITLVNDSAQKVKFCMGDEGAYIWVHPDMTYIKYGTRMDWINNLVYAYRMTGEEKYLKKWLSIWEDFDANFYAKYDEYKQEYGDHFSGENIGFMKVGQLNVGKRAQNRILGLSEMPVNKYIDTQGYARMLMGQSRDAAAISVNKETPNHFLYGYSALLQTRNIFNTVKIRNRLADYESAMSVFVDENYNPDGGETEMSIHYNYDLFPYYNAIKNNRTNEEPIAWLEKLGCITEYKLRMLASIITPTGHNPSLAHDYITEDAFDRIKGCIEYFGGDSVTEAIIERLTGNSASDPSFTSIAFPYTGYYVMRSGWDSNADYMFFMGSRFGRGHVEMNKLDVTYSAFGDDILTSSPSSYSNDSTFAPYDRFLESSLGNNTISVDGYSQRRLIGAYSDFSEPEESLWHTSDVLDYAEGTYSGGYNKYQGMWDERKKAAVDDVSHKRQVLVDKRNHIAVVCDSMTSPGEHTYTQSWNFAKRINSEEMIEQQGNSILTNSNLKGVGVELYSFSPSTLNFAVMCGDKNGETYKGWYLERYGTSYTPCVHTETKLTGTGEQQIITFIVPKESSDTRIKKIKSICGGAGFSATLANGSEIICLLNCKASNYGTISFSGNMIYITNTADGKMSGVAIGAEHLTVEGRTIGENKLNFEIIKDTDISTEDITDPEGFFWGGDGADAKPVYMKGR